MPNYTTAYTFEHDNIQFEDFFGKTTFGNLKVYDPGDFSTWYQRNALEVTKYLKESSNNVMIVKGVGTYVYDRDVHQLVKKIAILENSCRLLSIKASFD
jgi:L-fuculose-phosphate aldolase